MEKCRWFGGHCYFLEVALDNFFFILSLVLDLPTMASKKTDLGQLKFAEKLVILNDRSQGMLTRIYNVKKACAAMESKPRYLKEESVRSAISQLVKKFPQMDVKRNSVSFGGEKWLFFG